jgi:TonB-dependent starch-binding outer membrane protein SusC
MKMTKRLRHLAALTAGFWRLMTLLILALILNLGAWAQQKTITGKVLDNNSRPLPGVTVSVKNKNTATTTNESGDFSISAALNDVLVFTYVGFREQQERVGASNTINIALSLTANDMNEVVVVGYGTLQKKEVTGSVVSIKTDNLPKTANTSINNLLQGRAAGLNLDLRSAQPGGRLNVNIRGAGEPLYVIDGVPIFNNRAAEPAIVSFGSAVETGFNGGVDRDPLSNLNPADIESVDVLKDASATAIYGSAAANGVILITTKKGKADGRVTTEYRGSYTAQTPKDYFELLNAKEFMQQQVRLAKDNFLYLANAAPYGNSTPGTFTPLFTQAQIDAAGSGTDWLDLLMRNGHIHEHNIAISGGSEKTKVYSSFNYYNNQAILENSDFVRLTGRVNLEQKISDRIKLMVNVTMSQVNSNNTSTGNGGNSEKYNSLQSAYSFSPALDIFDNTGKFTRTLNTQITNPAAFLIMEDKLRTNRVFVAPNLEFKILDNLKLNLVGGIDRTKSDRRFFMPSKAQNYLFPGGFAQISNQAVHNYSFEGYATWNKTIGEHNIGLVGGGGYYKNFSEDNSMQAADFFTDALGYNNIGLATNKDKTLMRSFRSPDGIKISQFFRANYSYQSKYIFTFNARNDGSSSFAPNKKWGFFPGFAAAWRISQEEFMANAKIISELKLRGGYGTVGSDAGLNALALYGTAGGSFLIGNTYYPSVALTQLPNPDLSWETIKSTNIGIDFGLWNNRITGTIDVFRRDRTDILDIVPLPANNAVSQLNTNLGSQRTEGIEFAITSKNFTGDFSWETSFNISNFKRRWIERNPYYVLRPWESATDRLDVIYGWRTNGVLQSNTDKPDYMPDARLGNMIYVDNNGDKKLNADDVVVLGYANPKWSFGLDNRFAYKNFDLDIFVYGKLKQSLYNNLASFYAPDRIGIPAGQNTLQDIKKVWSADNPTGTLPGIANNPYAGANPAPFPTGVAIPAGNTDFYLQDVNFLRVRNITLGYTFRPKKYVQSARLFVDVQNVALWTNYNGFDPEIAGGNEGNPYPQALSTTIGISVGF